MHGGAVAVQVEEDAVMTAEPAADAQPASSVVPASPLTPTFEPPPAAAKRVSWADAEEEDDSVGAMDWTGSAAKRVASEALTEPLGPPEPLAPAVDSGKKARGVRQRHAPPTPYPLHLVLSQSQFRRTSRRLIPIP